MSRCLNATGLLCRGEQRQRLELGRFLPSSIFYMICHLLGFCFLEWLLTTKQPSLRSLSHLLQRLKASLFVATGYTNIRTQSEKIEKLRASEQYGTIHDPSNMEQDGRKHRKRDLVSAFFHQRRKSKAGTFIDGSNNRILGDNSSQSTTEGNGSGEATASEAHAPGVGMQDLAVYDDRSSTDLWERALEEVSKDAASSDHVSIDLLSIRFQGIANA